MTDSSEPKAEERSEEQDRPRQHKVPAVAELMPERGRLLGLDFGTRRIGIAVTDDEQRIASPLENYSRSRPEVDALRLKTLAGEYRAVGVVVGLPIHMGGEEGQKAREARRFGAWAAAATALPLAFWDERMTSALAEDYLRSAQLSPKKRKARLDKVAAQIMLQSYLESRTRGDR
jgi:putative Holliday junction resolvase